MKDFYELLNESNIQIVEGDFYCMGDEATCLLQLVRNVYNEMQKFYNEFTNADNDNVESLDDAHIELHKLRNRVKELEENL